MARMFRSEGRKYLVAGNWYFLKLLHASKAAGINLPPNTTSTIKAMLCFYTRLLIAPSACTLSTRKMKPVYIIKLRNLFIYLYCVSPFCFCKNNLRMPILIFLDKTLVLKGIYHFTIKNCMHVFTLITLTFITEIYKVAKFIEIQNVSFIATSFYVFISKIHTYT